MTTKQYLTTEEFLGAIKIQPEPLEVPGLGWVEVRALSMNDVTEIQAAHRGNTAAQTIAAVAAGLVQPKLSPDQIAELGEGNPGILVTISNRIFDLSGTRNREQATS